MFSPVKSIDFSRKCFKQKLKSVYKPEGPNRVEMEVNIIVNPLLQKNSKNWLFLKNSQNLTSIFWMAFEFVYLVSSKKYVLQCKFSSFENFVYKFLANSTIQTLRNSI